MAEHAKSKTVEGEAVPMHKRLAMGEAAETGAGKGAPSGGSKGASKTPA